MTPLLGRIAPGLTARLNLVSDLFLLVAALVGAQLTVTDTHHAVALTWVITGVLTVWVVTASALRHYDPWSGDRDALDDAMMVSVLMMAVATILFGLGLIAPQDAPTPHVGRFLLFAWLPVLSLRLWVFRRFSRRFGPLDEVLIVGTGPLGRFTGEDLDHHARARVLGFLSFPDETRPSSMRNRYLGSSSELGGLLKTMPVSEVYVAGDALRHGHAMQDVIHTCEQLGIPFALPAYSFRLERARPVEAKAVADGYLHYLAIDNKPKQLALKRLFDIVSSAVALWALLPLLGIVALVIRLTSRGPIFFRQVRVGLHGKPFHMLKFRSMVMDAERLKAALENQNEQTGPVFKMKNDPRITRIGRFIRKYSIDELPQLINVLRGDMSVVGPRPPVPNEVAKYEPWQRRRLSVRPGLTCIWQVSGRNQITFEQWMYLDMQYIDHWSLAQDMSLIFRTVPVVLTGRGAS